MSILMVVDKKGRVQYNRAKILKKYIPNIDILCLDRNNKIEKNYDIIYFSHFSLFKKFPKRGKYKTICSITSHKCINNLNVTLKDLKKFDKISVNNRILYSIFNERVNNLCYTPNGVDTKLFSFKNKKIKNRLVFGWVGNKDRAEKNFHTIYLPLRDIYSEFDFKAIVTSKKDDGKDLLSYSQMVEFYHSLDFFLVTSSTEGTPNPGLEALSCGVPVICTKVGNMVEIIKEGFNGFYCNNNICSFKDKINMIKTLSYNKIYLMRKNARDSIKEWDWAKQYKKWYIFLNE